MVEGYQIGKMFPSGRKFLSATESASLLDGSVRLILHAATDQLDQGDLGGVRLPETQFDDPGIPPVTIGVRRCDVVE